MIFELNISGTSDTPLWDLGGSWNGTWKPLSPWASSLEFLKGRHQAVLFEIDLAGMGSGTIHSVEWKCSPVGGLVYFKPNCLSVEV